jgi:hypothetical protein
VSESQNPQHREIVEAGGGRYLCTGGLPGYVLFHNPTTGSTLALEEQNLTAVAVRFEIRKNNSDFGRA